MPHAVKMIRPDEHMPHGAATADVRTHVRRLILDLVRTSTNGTGCHRM